MKRILLLSILLLLCTLSVFSQRVDKVGTKCPAPNSNIYSSILAQRDGNVTYVPCPNKVNYFDNLLTGTQGATTFNGSGQYTFNLFTGKFFQIGNTNYVMPTNFCCFAGSINSFLVTTTAINQSIFNQYNTLDVVTNTTGSSGTGFHWSVDNRFSSQPTNFLTGGEVSVQVEHTTSTATGFLAGAVSGGAGADGTTNIIGLQTIARGQHNANITNVISALVQVGNIAGSGTTTLSRGVQIQYLGVDGTTTELRGLSFDGWQNFGASTVGTLSVIYSDDTPNTVTNATTKYFINSLNTAPSRMAGNIAFTDNTKGIILKSPDNTCHLIAVSNANALSASTVACP